jgi:hypothetical protein
VLSAFGDESHDEKRVRVFAVAGLLGDEQEWNDLEVAWLARTEGKIFHAAECETDAGDFAGIAHATNQKLYADLAKLIARSKLIGHTAVVSLQEYRTAFPSDLSDEPYYWCFLDAVRALGEVGYLSVPQDHVEFTFDHNVEREYNATLLYEWIVNRSRWNLKSFLAAKISFACRKTVGIQVADLVAREGMKNLDNQIGPTKRHTRGSMKALAATRRLHFEYFRHGDFERKKKEAADILVPVARVQDYRRWLAENGLADSVSNRIRYLRR